MPQPAEPALTDQAQIEAFLDQVPVSLDRARFARFALGFPRRYLAVTSALDVLKHFALVESLGSKSAISSLGRHDGDWRLVVVARDRHALFARIAGSLFLFGANVLSARAIGNASGVVLDEFEVADRAGRLEASAERRRLQAFLVAVADGRVDLEAALREAAPLCPAAPLELSWTEDPREALTRLRVGGVDAPGLLYQITRRISEAGCEIQRARVETLGAEVRDEFQLSCGGQPLDESRKQQLAEVLAGVRAPAPTPGERPPG